MDETPNGLKQIWIDGEYKYTVRIHKGNTEYTSSELIYRVSRQIITNSNTKIQGSGLEYLGTDGIWYHTSVLIEYFRNGEPNPNYNAEAARITHISVVRKEK